MYSGSVAATGTQSAGSAPSTASAQVRSRPATRSACCCGRCTITTRSGLCVASARAASSIGLYATTRVGSMPHEPATITFGRASSMRAASSRGPKPPNTTECTAPSRAQASMAITASGTIAR
jgi:hypothetical protein